MTTEDGGRLRFPNGYGHLGTLQTDGSGSQYFSSDFLALGVFYEIEDTKGSDLQKKEGSSLLTMLSGVYGVAMAWPAKRLSSFVPSPIINWHF